MADIKFDGKVAVVTGAGAGIGRIHAIELAKRGARVVVNDLGVTVNGDGENRSAAEKVVKEIRDMGGVAVANFDSVSSMDGGENIIQSAVASFGSVDILVNNAGIIRDRTLNKMTEDDWDRIISVHLKGAFTVTKPALKIMKEKNYGRIIFTTSGSALYGDFGQANYAAAKMGLIGLMHVLTLETSKYNIKCNTIAPNAASRMTEELIPPPMLKLLKPEYITPLVLYLASEENIDAGMIFNCFGGFYSRTAVMCSSGTIIGDGKGEISPEDIRDNWQKISSIDNPRILNSIAESFGYISPLLKVEK